MCSEMHKYYDIQAANFAKGLVSAILLTNTNEKVLTERIIMHAVTFISVFKCRMLLCIAGFRFWCCVAMDCQTMASRR